jgi:hypothetical protein
MATISYKVTKRGNLWSVLRDGEASVGYFTREAAFELAFAEAGADLKYGRDIVIEVAARESDDLQGPRAKEFNQGEGRPYIEREDHSELDPGDAAEPRLSSRDERPTEPIK